jgi:predicted  nucleic acid-binding Zn-ribbon protein
MRDQLESIQGEKQRALQQAAADALNEIQQHVVTIRTQREEMEHLIEAHTAEIQQLRRSARDEQRLLKETIAALREQLEIHHGRS